MEAFDPSSAKPVEGFDPQSATPVREVGAIESALRTAAQAAAPVLKIVNLGIGVNAGRLADTLHNWSTGRNDTFYADAAIGGTQGQEQNLKDAYAEKQDESFSPAGEFLGNVASIPMAVVGQGVAPGINRATEVLDRGGSLSEAGKAGAATGSVAQALQMLSLGGGAKLAEKVGGGILRKIAAGGAAGAGTNVVGGIVGRGIENEALPEGEQFKDLQTALLDKKALVTDAALGLGFGALGGHAGAKKAKTKTAAAEANKPPPFPEAEMTPTGTEGEYRAPNGATITKEAWESSSPKIREGWLKAAPEPEKVPVGETAEVGPEALADTRAAEELKTRHPSGPVAEVADAVIAERQAAAVKLAEIKKAQADAAELRRAAESTQDPDLQAALRKRADKLDPPEKVAVDEVKEGQPEIKADEPKSIPEGEAKEIVEPKPEVVTEPIPTGEATEITRSGVEPAIPAPEAKELYIPPEKQNAPDQISKQEGVQQERVPGDEGRQAPETGAGDSVQRAAEGGREAPGAKEALDLGLPQIDGGALPEATKTATAKEGSSGKVTAEKSETSTLPSIDEAFMTQQQRAKEVRMPEPDERGRRQARAALEKGIADGTIDKDGGALALWALDKNPNLAKGLRIEAKSDVGKGLGSYNSATKIVKLFQGNNGHTAVHEIFHHIESMMPSKVQRGIRRAWRGHLQAEMKTSTPEVRAALEDAVKATTTGDPQAFDRLKSAFNDGVLDKNKHYNLTDPSEFWAVNGARILADKKHAGRGTWRAEAKQWIREMIEHVKGTIGLRSDSAVIKALNEMLDATKTTGDRKALRRMIVEGEVARDALDIAPGKPAKRELAPESRAEVVERKLFDRFNRVAKLQKTEAPKSEGADIVQADQLYQGRAQHRGELLEKEHIKPLGKALEAAKKAGVSVRDADDYLTALHAPERNAVIAARNPKMQDGGSGITNAQAKAIIDSFTPKQREHLDAVAKIVHNMNRAKLDGLVADGLVKPEVRDALNRQYKYYVPFKTLEAEAEFTGVGRGYELRGNDITAAMGRSSKASSPIAASVMDASRSIIRGEKARVDRAIYTYAINSRKAQEFISPYRPKRPPPQVMKRDIGPDGKVREVVDSQKVQDLTLSLMVGGKQRRVFVPDQLLRDQLRKVGSVHDPGEILGAIGRATGMVGRMLTEFNPAFTAPNAVRDAITVAIRTGAHGGLSTAKVMAGIPTAWKTIIEHKAGAKSADAKLYEEFLQAGGKTGAYGIQGVTDTMRRLEKAGAELGYDEHKGGYARKMKNAIGDMAHVVSQANEVLEYASRFSVYKQARAAGYSPAKAAGVAKEITVNFNRSGEYSRAMNSVLVFANAALQGLRNTVVYSKNPKVQRGMLGMVALGAASQMYNEQVGGMNEETGELNANAQNDAVADKNMTILAPSSRSGIKIPLPPEYAGLFAVGRRLMRAATQGDAKKEEAAGIVNAVIDSTAPVRFPEADSTALAVGKAMTPTLLSPLADLFLNQSYFGSPIVPEQHNKRAPAPYHTMSRSNTSDIAKMVSELANAVTGGDNVKPGVSQKVLGPLIAPEGIEHIVGFFTGGAGQLAMQSKNIVKNAGEGKPQDVNKLPVANRFVFTEPQSYTSRRYEELAGDFEYAKDYRKLGEEGKIDPSIAYALPEYEATEQELQGLFKELRATKTTSEDREPIQKRIKEAQARVIKTYNEHRNGTP